MAKQPDECPVPPINCPVARNGFVRWKGVAALLLTMTAMVFGGTAWMTNSVASGLAKDLMTHVVINGHPQSVSAQTVLTGHIAKNTTLIAGNDREIAVLKESFKGIEKQLDRILERLPPR